MNELSESALILEKEVKGMFFARNFFVAELCFDARKNDKLICDRQKMANFHHQNMVSAVDSYFSGDTGTFIMISEFCEYGLLRE